VVRVPKYLTQHPPGILSGQVVGWSESAVGSGPVVQLESEASVAAVPIKLAGLAAFFRKAYASVSLQRCVSNKATGGERSSHELFGTSSSNNLEYRGRE
jgi:hypothetical protein